MDLSSIFNVGTLLNTFNTATIVILAGLGCLMTAQAGMMNIGIDGMMTAGAFAAAVGSWYFGSWGMGLVCALLAGLIFGLFYGVMVIRYKSDEFIIGVALNIFAVALTTFILRTVLKQSGSFHPASGAVNTLPYFSLGEIGGTAVNISVMVPLSWLLVALCAVMLYRTPAGFWLRAAGEHLGLLLGAFFMATDYVTCPMSGLGRIIMGLGCGVLLFVIRSYASYIEGCSFAILFMNVLTPLIDRFTAGKLFGEVKKNG